MLVGTTAWHSRKPSLLPTEDPTLGWSATRWLDSCSTCAMLSTPLRIVLVAALALSLPPLAVACSDDTSSSPSVSSAGSAGSAGTGGAGGQNGGAAGLGGAGGVPGVPAVRELGCKSPTPAGGGFERCANGVLHRTEVLACPDARAEDVPCAGSGPPFGGGGAGTCTREQCGPLASPVCVRQSSGAPAQPSCQCEGNCLADTDCPGGAVCVCSGGTGSCAAAGCTSDAACGGGLCLQVVPLPASSCAAPAVTFACTTPDDMCDDDADCGTAPGVACRLDGAVRKCVRLPTPCCEEQRCGTTCWDASDCGGAACVEALDTFCLKLTTGPTPTHRRCAKPAGECVKDADCTNSPKGTSCVWDGTLHRCGPPTINCAPG